MSIDRAFSIVNGLNLISKIFLWEYLGYAKEKDKIKKIIKNEDGEEDASNNSISTLDEMEEQKLFSLEKLIKENKI